MSRSEDFLEQIRKAAWRTSGARFNAARRLKRRDWFATFSIAMFSAASVFTAVLQKIYKFDHKLDDYLTAIAIFIGLFVIVISVIEVGAANLVKADHLHRNAEDLNSFHRKVELALATSLDGGAFDLDEMEALRIEYEQLKQRCPFNHEPIDALEFDASRRNAAEYRDPNTKRPAMNLAEATLIRVSAWFQPFSYFAILWLFLAVLAWRTLLV